MNGLNVELWKADQFSYKWKIAQRNDNTVCFYQYGTEGNSSFSVVSCSLPEVS